MTATGTTQAEMSWEMIDMMKDTQSFYDELKFLKMLGGGHSEKRKRYVYVGTDGKVYQGTDGTVYVSKRKGVAQNG